MKVIIIHASDVESGGIVNATLFHAAALINAGYDAEIWTASKGLAARAEKLSIPFFYHYWIQNVGLSIVHPKLIAKALRSRQEAMAVIHQGEKLLLFGRIWLRGVPESVIFHNAKIGKRRYFERWLVLSSEHRDELLPIAGKRAVRVIRNGPLPDAVMPLRHRNFNGGIRTIGCLGNFGTRKATEVLIKAFAETVRRGHDLKLILAGDGHDRLPCQRLARELGIAERISWPGWQTNTQKFFSSIDLFCLPSRDEPFGIVITEAMQAGLPVIATDSYGPGDIVVQNQTGWLIPADDVDALVNAIEEALSDSKRAANYGAAGYARVQHHYSLLAAGKVLAEALDLLPADSRHQALPEAAEGEVI